MPPKYHNDKIRYQLPVTGHVQLKIYDAVGREVTTLVDGFQDEGMKTVRFDAGNLSAGVYYYRLTTGEFIEMRKMILVR